MAERMVRTQILLEPEQHRELAEIAQQEGRSVSDVVRQMIRDQLEQREKVEVESLKRDLEVLERMRRRREQILAERGGKPIAWDAADLINSIREEQDERNTGLAVSHRD